MVQTEETQKLRMKYIQHVQETGYGKWSQVHEKQKSKGKFPEILQSQTMGGRCRDWILNYSELLH